MDPCVLFLMDDYSSSDDSNLEDFFNDDIEQTVVILAAKETLDMRPQKLKGSSMGRLCIPRNHALGHNMLMQDYFAEVPTYPSHLFHRRYRMRQSLSNKIIDTCGSNNRYFKRKRTAAGLVGFSARQKISVFMRIFAYGIPVDYADESHLLARLAKGDAPACNYNIDGRDYTMGYYLVDGIYSDWVTFVKSIKVPMAEFAKARGGPKRL
ncbi:uncharacterized protein [Lolium perenne]|uniref:uncharacterized protein n=1 Tax=Lolium perenne TaxID=4522 RepID=UPI003A994F04